MIISFVPVWMYRLLYVRYLFAAALGVWLATCYKRPKKWLIVGALISFSPLHFPLIKYAKATLQQEIQLSINSPLLKVHHQNITFHNLREF